MPFERLALTLATALAAAAPSTASPVLVETTDWMTAHDLTVDFFDGFAVLHPAVNINGAVGDSSVSDPGELQTGAHDPYRNGFSLQGVELAGTLELGDGLGATAIYNIFEDEEDDSVDGEFEEAYGTLDVPGLGLKGGRYLNAFGFENDIHVHGWNFVDQPLVYGRFLGDHGLRTEGGALTLPLAGRWGTNVALSFGNAVSHDHSHGNGHGHEHGHEHGEEHGHGGGGHGHGHEHGGGEDLLFDGFFFAGRLDVPWNSDDFNRWNSHLSVSAGDNALGGQTVVYGTGLAYEWLETGYEPGGARFRTSAEIFGRSWTAGGDGHHDHARDDEDDHDHEHHDHEHHDHEHGHEHADHGGHGHDGGRGSGASGTDFGLLVSALYSPTRQWDMGGRIEYVSGDSEAGLDERWRFSPVATWWADEEKSLSLRLQYNLDSLPGGEEHSVWLQFGLSWGGH